MRNEIAVLGGGAPSGSTDECCVPSLATENSETIVVGSNLPGFFLVPLRLVAERKLQSVAFL